MISAPLVYTAWGLVWLLGYGAMWLSVRGQHPYRGPSGSSIAAVFVLAGFAAAVVLVMATRAVAGIDGRSARYRRIVLAMWAAGYLILFLVQAGLQQLGQHAGARVRVWRVPLVLAGLVVYPRLRPRTRPARVRPRGLAGDRGRSRAWQAPAAIVATARPAAGRSC